MGEVMRHATVILALTVIVTICSAGQPQQAPSSAPPGYATARRGIATLDDAYRQFLSLAVNQERIKLDRKVRELDFTEVSIKLEELGIIDGRWCYDREMCLRRDVLAYMCASYMGCRTGLFTSLCGMTRRYAHREMLYRGIIAPGTPNSYVSGTELLAIVGRVAEITETQPDPELTSEEIP
jgi:hypothetical protein